MKAHLLLCGRGCRSGDAVDSADEIERKHSQRSVSRKLASPIGGVSASHYLWIFTFGFVALGWALAPSARAQYYEKVFDFTQARLTGFVNKGAAPDAGLVQG